MTPAKRRPATPASQGPTRVAPDVPIAPPDAPVPDELVTAPVPPAETEDGTQLLGPDGEPIAQEAPAGDASGDSAPPTGTGQDDSEGPATTQSPRRPLALYPLPVWPD
jgi:hypothetical protein